jgi:hypothetical protein
MLKPGDKVKFLNASGGGVVTKIIDSRMVGVMGEEGFDIPTMISELILIDPKDAGGRFFESHYNIPGQIVADDTENEMEVEKQEDDRSQPLSPVLTRNRKSEEIWLAFIPHDQKWLITGMVDVFLINNTSFDVLYNIFTKTPNGHYEGMDYGSIFPDTRQLINTINREILTRWTEGNLQFLFHKEQSPFVLPPFNSEFKVEGKRFYKEGNYREHSAIEGKGIVVKVVSLTEYFNETRPADQKGPSGREQSAEMPTDLIFKYQVAPREAEVDLHIHELVDDPGNMEKSEILEFQKATFTRCMEGALQNGFLKVTFIHGVGNGVLKNTLTEMVRNYKGIVSFDAPMAKYGVGALEVRIPHNV